MQIPLQITFRNLEHSDAVEAKIRERVEQLEQFHHGIISCRVRVAAPPPRRQQGGLYHIRVDLKIPGKEIVVKRAPTQHHAHEDMGVAIRDCFDSVRRQLEDVARRRRGDVKLHQMEAHGTVASLISEGDYGFIAASDGTEVYFHRNAVAHQGFSKLTVGDEVRFTLHPGEGEKGPQASVVIPIGKHHLAPDRP